MGNRLYVGNLSYSLNKEDLRQAFASCGTVQDTHVLIDRETGQSRGFGFVTMATSEEAQNAIREMNGAVVGGRPLRVNEAEDRPQRSGGGGGSYHAGGNGGGSSGGGNGRPRVYENNGGGGGRGGRGGGGGRGGRRDRDEDRW